MKCFIGVVIIIVQLIPCYLVTVKPIRKSSPFYVQIVFGAFAMISDSQI